jgi:hypothetical protein
MATKKRSRSNPAGRKRVKCATCEWEGELRGYRLHHLNAHECPPPAGGSVAAAPTEVEPESQPEPTKQAAPSRSFREEMGF